MTLTNAILHAIVTPGVPGPGGETGAGTETSVGARCLLDDVRTAQRMALGAKIGDATSCLYARHKVMDVSLLMIGRDVLVTLDGAAEKRYRILHRDERVMPHDQSLSHVICFLQPVIEG